MEERQLGISRPSIITRLDLLLAGHAVVSIGLSLLSLDGTVDTALIRYLLPAWGLVFFAFFYLVGQTERPRPLADLITGLRMLLTTLFYILVSVDAIGVVLSLILLLVLETADGLDGWLARRLGTTKFGGVWDMEIDAFSILLLSVAAFAFAGLPLWALWPGLIRYVFFFLFLWLKPPATSFPPALSWFSRIVCVAAVFCLGSPWYLPNAATVAIALTTILLSISFIWETIYYIRTNRHTRNR